MHNTENVGRDKTPVVPAGTGPSTLGLSLGIASGGFVFVSGAVAFHPDTREIVGDTVEEQTRQTMRNIGSVLAAAGLDFTDVVQSRVFLTEVQRDFAAFDATYREFVTEPYPARTTVGVQLAVPGLLVEIDVVARQRA